jgi:quercetin dioxygenase-like cupin family protein
MKFTSDTAHTVCVRRFQMSSISTYNEKITNEHAAERVRNYTGTPLTVELKQREVWGAEIKEQARLVTCLEGRVWVTQQNDGRDYVLNPGEIFVVTNRGRLVLEALLDSTVQILELGKA